MDFYILSNTISAITSSGASISGKSLVISYMGLAPPSELMIIMPLSLVPFGSGYEDGFLVYKVEVGAI